MSSQHHPRLPQGTMEMGSSRRAGPHDRGEARRLRPPAESAASATGNRSAPAPSRTPTATATGACVSEGGPSWRATAAEPRLERGGRRRVRRYKRGPCSPSQGLRPRTSCGGPQQHGSRRPARARQRRRRTKAAAVTRLGEPALERTDRPETHTAPPTWPLAGVRRRRLRGPPPPTNASLEPTLYERNPLERVPL